MDRNVVIATILITGIMLLWLYMMPETTPIVDDVLPDTSALVEQNVVRVPLPPVVESIEVPTREPRFITIETDLYTARMSDVGGTLVGFALKEYQQFDQTSAVQMVSANERGAIGIEFQSPDGRNLDTRNFDFSVQSYAEVIDATQAPVELAFVTQIESGSLRLAYTFSPGDYEIGLAVTHSNAASFQTGDGYELVWNGAIPFSEDVNNRQEEVSKVGIYARSGDDVDGFDLRKSEEDGTTLRGNISWIGVKNKYFGAVVLADPMAREAELWGERIGRPDDLNVAVNLRASLFMGTPSGSADEFRVYLGPMDYRKIKRYDGVYEMVDYGWNAFEWMTRPLATILFIPAFAFLSSFISSYGLVIIVFCFCIKLLLFPLTRSSYKSMAKMRELQPKMKEIKEKYADSPEKQQQATIKLYKESGTNPLGACLPMFLQYPIIIALWQFLQQSIEIRQQGFLWADDLSAPDAILHLPFSIPFYGDFVAGFTVLMGISLIFQMRLQATPQSGAQAKIFMYVMPVFIFVIFNRLPSGLSLYYFCYNVLSALQQQFINVSTKKAAVAKAQSPARRPVSKKNLKKPPALARSKSRRR